LKHKGYKVTERPISIDEIIEASKNGTLQEAFGTGTAVGVAMIDEIDYKGEAVHFPKHNPSGQMILDTVNGVRDGTMEDELGWIVRIDKQLV
jgi:branched-chain amino acid aminotransferase